MKASNPPPQVTLLDGIGLRHFVYYQRRLRQGRLEGIRGVSLFTGGGRGLALTGLPAAALMR